MKGYILVLLSVLGIGAAATSNLSAAATPEINSAQPVEMMNLSEMDEISELNLEDITETAEITTPVYTAKAITAANPATTPKVTAYNYTVNSYDDQIAVNPGNLIHKTGKLIYAHNDPSLMLSALSLKAGDTFTVNENGTVKTYRVAATEIYAKTTLEQGGNMAKVAYAAKDSGGRNHAVALMTCYERSRNAEHRFVVFGDLI